MLNLLGRSSVSWRFPTYHGRISVLPIFLSSQVKRLERQQIRQERLRGFWLRYYTNSTILLAFPAFAKSRSNGRGGEVLS